MSNFFTKAQDNPNQQRESLLGPRYKYSELIKNPSELGMSTSGDKISQNFKGLTAYLDLMFSGGGRANRQLGPLGPSFFVETGAKCNDKASGEQVKRSIYINTIPQENTGVIAGFNATFGGAQGFVPAIIHNIENINPIGIFSAFMEGTDPECHSVTLPTRRQNEFPKMQTGYLSTNDIKQLSPCLFPNKINPFEPNKRVPCLEGFDNNSQDKNNTINNDLEILQSIIHQNQNKGLNHDDLITYLYLISLILIFTSLIVYKK